MTAPIVRDQPSEELHEILRNLAGVGIILLLERRFRLRWGRTWLEAIRIDPTSNALFGIPTNIWGSFAATLAISPPPIRNVPRPRLRTHGRSGRRERVERITHDRRAALGYARGALPTRRVRECSHP